MRRWLVMRVLYGRDNCLFCTTASAALCALRSSQFSGRQVPVSEMCACFSELMRLDGHRLETFDSSGAYATKAVGAYIFSPGDIYKFDSSGP